MTATQSFYVSGVNPEPWTSPSASVARANGKMVPRLFKSAALGAYQESVRQALVDAYPEVEPLEGPVELEFFFWRQLVRYEGERRRSTKKRVDATNLQKACEDAIQGVLIANDRDVVHVSSWVIEQHHDTDPLIVIQLTPNPQPPEWTTRAHQHVLLPDEPAGSTDFDVESYF